MEDSGAITLSHVMGWYSEKALIRSEEHNLLGVIRYLKPHRWGSGEAYSMRVISLSQFINSKNAISCFHSGQLQVTLACGKWPV